MGKQIDNVEAIAKCLLDNDVTDRRITITTYNQIQGDTKGLEILTGKKSFSDWKDFKAAFVKEQGDHGFSWVAQSGHGGPLFLESISIPAGCGEELAQSEFLKKIPGDDFTKLVNDNFPSLFGLATESLLPDISQARENFKEQSSNNKSFKFTPGRSSMRYVLAIKDYTYKDKSNKRNEHAMGEAIYAKIKNVLKLDVLNHSQHGRGAGKYRNLDFEGFRVQKTLNEDEFLMYSFELKPDNSVTAVSQAVSQAVNYHSQSNFTYIVIPQFDANTFPDAERLDDLLEMCKANRLGVLSVNMDVESHEVVDIVEVLPAPQTPLDDPDRLATLVEESSLEKCPLCRKIVDTANDRVRCGWLVNTGEDQRCMKELLEAKIAPAPSTQSL